MLNWIKVILKVQVIKIVNITLEKKVIWKIVVILKVIIVIEVRKKIFWKLF